MLPKATVPNSGVAVGEEKKRSKKSRWAWTFGLVSAGLAGAAVVLRGCWHSKMSWPVRAEGHCYQVCLSCGIKRLFDEREFRGYGPYKYDLHMLIAWDRSRRLNQHPEEPAAQRTAS